MPINSKRLLHWLELAGIALRKKPKTTTSGMIDDLRFGTREFSEPPAERSVSQGEMFPRPKSRPKPLQTAAIEAS
jgi:hypothetical protein